ncbi:MAG TPA: oxygenase MpaB family protein [Polyangiales bacterium]
MTVSRDQLEASLEKARARVRDPREGLYGPSSMMWRVNREQLLFMSGARAVLLQEAHPFVAHGVDQHSQTKTDPVGRFVRTFKHVHGMLFGDLDTALTSARRVHKYHTAIRGQIGEDTGAYRQGSSYEANNEAALLWVHATLWESSILSFELLFHPLSNEEKERYYQETKLFAYMFGIPDEILPPNWPEFIEYNQRMWNSDELAVGNTAREMASFILSPNNHFHARFSSLIKPVTTALLPARFREDYGLHYGLRERATFEATVLAVRAGWRLLPRQQRFTPAYLAARKRIGTGIVPNLPERLVDRLYPSRLNQFNQA